MLKGEDLEDEAPVRRSPFSDNPVVGERGSQTHQRILAAALEVFGQTGYGACRVERITEVAGCSRPSFYQYFSSKEDVFRQLAGQVSRLLLASAGELPAVTPDAEGWHTLNRWVARYADIYDRYEPVFAAFTVAESSDATVAAGAERVRVRHVDAVMGKLRASDAPNPEATIAALLNTLARTNSFRSLLQSGPRALALPRRRLNDSLTDVVHRALFGMAPGVNIRETRPVRSTGRPRAAELLPPAQADGQRRLGPAGRKMRQSLLEAGMKVFISRGYHATRVDDITTHAGVSHGTFYRYFRNKDEVFRVLAARAGTHVVDAVNRLPDVAADPDVRASADALARWLVDYAETYEHEAAIIRVWTEAMAHDPQLNSTSAVAIEQLRRRIVQFLLPRGFGDIDADALALLGLVDGEQRTIATAGRLQREKAQLVADIIRRGFLGARADSAGARRRRR